MRRQELEQASGILLQFSCRWIGECGIYFRSQELNVLISDVCHHSFYSFRIFSIKLIADVSFGTKSSVMMFSYVSAVIIVVSSMHFVQFVVTCVEAVGAFSCPFRLLFNIWSQHLESGEFFSLFSYVVSYPLLWSQLLNFCWTHLTDVCNELLAFI